MIRKILYAWAADGGSKSRITTRCGHQFDVNPDEVLPYACPSCGLSGTPFSYGQKDTGHAFYPASPWLVGKDTCEHPNLRWHGKTTFCFDCGEAVEPQRGLSPMAAFMGYEAAQR